MSELHGWQLLMAARQAQEAQASVALDGETRTVEPVATRLYRVTSCEKCPNCGTHDARCYGVWPHEKINYEGDSMVIPNWCPLESTGTAMERIAALEARIRDLEAENYRLRTERRPSSARAPRSVWEEVSDGDAAE